MAFADKVAWIDEQAGLHKPDLFVTPQEYFGGVQKQFFDTDEPFAYEEDAIIEPMLELAKKHDMGIAVGALVNCNATGQVRERIYVIDPEHGVTGQFDKMMLPAYDHIDAGGITGVTPEDNYDNRAQIAVVKGARVSVIFCWEAYSNYIWHAITKAQPDIVLSMIKFGVCGWPKKGKDPKTGGSRVTGFGFGADGGWIERLHMAAKFDVACPIVCSTNSWNLPKRSRPLAGTIYPFDLESTLWYPPKGSRGNLEEVVIVDDIDYLRWRHVRSHKMIYHEEVGDWPSAECRTFTMMWKIKRMERKFLGLPPTPPKSAKPEAIKSKPPIQKDGLF